MADRPHTNVVIRICYQNIFDIEFGFLREIEIIVEGGTTNRHNLNRVFPYNRNRLEILNRYTKIHISGYRF